jgi:putative membrane protein
LVHGHGRRNPGLGVFYLFTTLIHTGVLGALLTLSDRVWYPLYASSSEPWGLTPLEDQQLGGVIMWVPACLTYLIGGLVLLAYWLHRSGEASQPAGVHDHNHSGVKEAAPRSLEQPAGAVREDGLPAS